MIWGWISKLHTQRRNALLSQIEQDELDDHSVDSPALDTLNMHHHIGAPQVATTFEAVEALHPSDRAFQNFRRKLTTFVNNLFLAQEVPLPGPIQPAAHDKVCHMFDWQPTNWPQAVQIQEHRYLKVHYESMVDWKLTTNYLRCNPSFHGQERYDCALVRTLDKDQNKKIIVIRLLSIFKYTVAGHTLDLALVQPMDAPTGPLWIVDCDLHLRCFRSRPCTSTEFISLQSIIRGALLVPDFSRHNDFFLVDSIDGDMFICAQRCGL